MSEIKLSSRAQQVYAWLTLPSPQGGEGSGVRSLRQQTLAEALGCSRWTIGRALKRLVEAGLLVDLGRREQRSKVYHLIPRPLLHPVEKGSQCVAPPQAVEQLRLYRYTFESVFQSWPEWEKFYPEVTQELRGVTDVHALWRQTFDGLYAINGRLNPTGQAV